MMWFKSRLIADLRGVVQLLDVLGRYVTHDLKKKQWIKSVKGGKTFGKQTSGPECLVCFGGCSCCQSFYRHYEPTKIQGAGLHE